VTMTQCTRLNGSSYPLYTPTKAEASAIRKGRAAYKRGDYVTLSQLHDELGTARRTKTATKARGSSEIEHFGPRINADERR